MQFRVNSAGTITVAHREGQPQSAYRLYVVYADNCAGVRPGPGQGRPTNEDPNTPPGFVPLTDTNLYYAYSDDHGETWVGGDGRENGRPYNSCGLPESYAASGRLVAKPGPDTAATGSYLDDQWFPWIDASPTSGIATAVTMDGNAFDGEVCETYGFTGWTGATPTGVPNFEPLGNLSGAPSHPRQSRFFRTETADPEHSCPDCTRFLGDYNGVAVDRLDRIHGVWTDMRRPHTIVQRPIGCEETPTSPACTSAALRAEDAYYARRPATTTPTTPVEPTPVFP